MHLLTTNKKNNYNHNQRDNKKLPSKCLVIIALLVSSYLTIGHVHVQCHAIAEATNETAQELHSKTNDTIRKESSENVRWLVVARQQQPQQQETAKPTATTQAKHQSIISAVSSSLAIQNQSEISTTTSMPSAPTTPSVQSWIESILINVEVMNLLQERRREKALAGGKEFEVVSTQQDNDETTLLPLDSSDSSSSPSSQAPTDSGEDLLESSLDATTEQNAPAQQQQQQPQDSELQLVESNNVSAVLSSHLSMSSSSPPPPVITMTTTTKRQSISCEKAYTACALREVCAPTLKAYNDDCQDLIQNRTRAGECPAKCLKAMISLRSSERGEDLVNCDCQGDEYCLQSKRQSQVCLPQVELAIEPKTIVSCSVASWICMADQLCSTALGYYYRNCQTLFSQRHCSEYCNNSLAVLYRQPKAEKLINCQCDGSEEFPCVRYKTYTEQLCLNKQQRQQQTTTPTQFNSGDDFVQTNTAVVANENNSEDSATATTSPPPANEDDNLTNDPSDLPPLAVHSSSASSTSWFSNINSGDGGGTGTSDDYDDQSEDGDSPIRSSNVAGDLSNSNPNFFNGIQAQPTIDDNWIPIVSHRYFTNLQLQQQQQEQQQQKVKQQRPPKTNFRRTQKNSSSSNGNGSGKQTTRTKSTSESKRRHSRPHMFALTSSASTRALPATSSNSLVGLMLTLLPTLILYAIL